jgi:hypothetical protein
MGWLRNLSGPNLMGELLGGERERRKEQHGGRRSSGVGAACDADFQAAASKPQVVHWVTVDTSVMDFVVKAIEEKLGRSGDSLTKRRE